MVPVIVSCYFESTQQRCAERGCSEPICPIDEPVGPPSALRQRKSLTVPTQPPATPARLLQLAWGYALPLIVEAAIRHRMFDALDRGPKTAAVLAAEAAISERGARAVLNALTSVELLSKDLEGRYSLTPESALFLVSTKPSFLGGVFRHASIDLIPRWLALNEIVRIGGPVRDIDSGASGAAHFHDFVEDIFPLSYPAARALADALVSNAGDPPVRVLDVAAGSGVWGIALAQRSPQARVTAVDLPPVLDVTRRVAACFGVGDRVETRAGDLFEIDFGGDYQIAVLGHILHSVGESRSRALLAKVRQALAPGGTIAVAEFLVDEARATQTNGLIFAVNMLVNTEEGDTYSFSEIAGWLQEAGFENVRTMDAPGPSPLILANRAS
jgi:ubiquinone/menaquinone biosynthesis C-methylase UbiE